MLSKNNHPPFDRPYFFQKWCPEHNFFIERCQMLWVSLSKSILDRSWQFRPLPAEFQFFFRFQKKWFLGGLEMVQNPHSWGWRNSHLFWCFFRLSTCTHLKHLNNASKILWKVPQVWGFWAFVDHPKTTFFETKKKLKFGREWPELSRMVLNRFGKAHP